MTESRCTLRIFAPRRAPQKQRDPKPRHYSNELRQHPALLALRRLPDERGQAHAHFGLAPAHIRLLELDDAHRHLGQDPDLYGRIDDWVGQGHTAPRSPWRSAGSTVTDPDPKTTSYTHLRISGPPTTGPDRRRS